MRLLVVGAPRSGTRFLASVLRASGLPVGHEQIDTGGCVSSYFAVYDDEYHGWHKRRGEKREPGMADQVWHLVRHPLAAAGSIASGMPTSWWRWQARHTGIDPELQPVSVRAARFWLAWTDTIDRDAEVVSTYRAEDIAERWPEIQQRLGVGCPPEQAFNPLLGHTGRARSLELDSLPDALALAIAAKARHYGYTEIPCQHRFPT